MPLPPSTPTQPEHIMETTCCIVGSGPAGAMLALLLARKGISVILLEAAKDFDRDFRGDTIHPPVLEIMYQLGLADRLFELPHAKLTGFAVRFANHTIPVLDMSHLKIRYPYVTMLQQSKFLELIIEEAKKYPHFQLIMEANVRELVIKNHVVRGVKYRTGETWHEIHASLTVGTDGRSSRIRSLANLVPIPKTKPLELLWFRLAKQPEDFRETSTLSSFNRGSLGILINRENHWQAAYMLRPNSYPQVRAQGLPSLRNAITTLLPETKPYIEQLQDWKQVPHLAVQVSHLKRWYIPGLLLLGDAAHIMSSYGGFGINLAVQDAVVAANILSKPLLSGSLDVSDLATVQRQRAWPTRLFQTFQAIAQRLLVDPVLAGGWQFNLSRLLIRLPAQRVLLSRLLTYGIKSIRVE